MIGDAGEGTGLRRSSLHGQLAEILRALIREGRMAPGTPLPSEKDLAATYRVSRQTVRHALADLVGAGLVEKRQGKGSCVRRADGAAPAATRRVGVLLAHLNGWFCMDALAGIEQLTRAAGYDLSVRTTDDPEQDASGQLLAVEQMREAGAAGIIVEPVATDDAVKRYFSGPRRRDFPVVFLDRYLEGCPVPWVVSDNFAGGRELGRHLLTLGHRHLAFLPPHEPGLVATDQRRNGLRAALVEAGLPLSLLVEVAPVRGQPHSVRRALETALGFPPPRRPTAVVCGADYIAAEVLFVLRALGWAVPGDMAVAGFDDMPYATWLQPPLTTVHQQPRKMGEMAAALLFDMLRTGQTTGRNVLVPVDLRVRGSTGPPRAMPGILDAGAKGLQAVASLRLGDPDPGSTSWPVKYPAARGGSRG